MSHFDLFRLSRIHQFYMVKYFTLTLSKDFEKRWHMHVKLNLYYIFVVKCIHLTMDNDTSDTRNRAVPVMDFAFLPLDRKKITSFKTVSSCANTQFTRKNAFVSDS